MFRWPAHSTLAPGPVSLSSMTNSWSVGAGCLGGTKPKRLLVNMTRPPGSGQAPML
jgi:hypothetical protein